MSSRPRITQAEQANRERLKAETDRCLAFDLPCLMRQLFTHVDAKGHPQTRADGTAEYDVLVPIPASLLRQLRAAIDQK